MCPKSPPRKFDVSKTINIPDSDFHDFDMEKLKVHLGITNFGLHMITNDERSPFSILAA